jgi:hypothetical protein
MPWNPAVFEQRVARVHRMGQCRPVRVVNLVTRGSIEERVLHVLRQKRALFAGLFDSDTDEVNFAALGQPAFLDAVRDLLDGEASPAAASAAEARAKLFAAAVPFLEALGEYLAIDRPPAPPDLVRRGTTALRAILDAVGGSPPDDALAD